MDASREARETVLGEDRTRPGTATDFDVSSAMVRAESAHLDATLHALVERLSAVPGLELAVSYRPGLLRRALGDLPYLNDLHRRGDPISRVVVAVGACSYWLHVDGGSIACGRELSSAEHGTRREQQAFADWADALFEDIALQNLVNHDSLVALRQLVEQGRA